MTGDTMSAAGRVLLPVLLLLLPVPVPVPPRCPDARLPAGLLF